jgi:hypothetical protein
VLLTPVYAAAAPSPIFVYPSNVANPRVPSIAPVAGGAQGLCMGVDAEFQYPLAGVLDTRQGATATVALRDDPRRQGKAPVTLSKGDIKVVIEISPASTGRVMSVKVRQPGNWKEAPLTGFTLPQTWTQVTLAITPKAVTLTAGTATATVPLNVPLVIDTLTVSALNVDDLNITGEGSLALGWENGYAAVANPAPGGEVAATLMGFDSYFVNAAPNKRDSPVMYVVNPKGVPATATVTFHATTELSGKTLDWVQSTKAAPRSSVAMPIVIPGGLATDIYHLRAVVSGDAQAATIDKHFLYAQRLADGVGTARFGLHDSDRTQLGFWPDALPIAIGHQYARWGYIVGPPWIKDFNGSWGIDPDSPSAQWNWNSHIDWTIAQGQTPYICIGGEPWLEWMREPGFDGKGMPKYPWGSLGGKPDDRRYRQFVHELASRYKGKVSLWEIQNEPNAFPPGGMDPATYVAVLKAAFEEIHAVDPKATVYGICGTGDFVPWMTKVFDLGGAKYMDAISFHTYVTPKLPEESNLPAKLDQVRALAAKNGKPLAFLNSETGTYVALREVVDKPISPERLDDLIARGTPTLSIPHGWPNYALDETTGSLSIVRNCVYNFLAGAKAFTFFGWNSNWPALDWITKQHGDDGFAMVSATKDGIRTPSRYTLAIGVLTAQMESSNLENGVAINDGDIRGGVFRTVGSGSTAVAWSISGKRTAVFDVRGQGVNAVSLFGQPVTLPKLAPSGGLLQVALTAEPVYIHVAKGTLTEQPSPIEDVRTMAEPDGGYRIRYTLNNRAATAWTGSVTYQAPTGWTLTPSRSSFNAPAGGKTTLETVARQAMDAPAQITVNAALSTPSGGIYEVPFPIKARPRVSVLRVSTAIGDFDSLPGAPLSISKPEQVMMGRPPALASLQEAQYWKGPSELSGLVKAAWTGDALTVAVKVHDANYRPPVAWPGVAGSCIELFLDFRRPGEGLGNAVYGPGVFQVIFKPADNKTDPPTVWIARGSPASLAGATATGALAADGDYVVTYTIPWKSLAITPAADTQFGLDVSIDGPFADRPVRKSQMALFGTASNNSDASGFGVAALKR